MDGVESSEPPFSSDQGTIYLSDIRVSELPKCQPDDRIPSPYAVITLDGEQRQETATLEPTQSPQWDDEFEFHARSPSSELRIRIFDRAPTAAYLIGDFAGKVEELADVPLHILSNNGATAGMLTMQLIYAPSYNTPPHDEYTYNPVATSFHEMVLFRNVPIKTTLPLYMSIIGEVLSSLERLVELLYGIAEIQPICLSALVQLSTTHKLLAARAQPDVQIQDVVFALRDMLTFADTSHDIRQIKGALPIIKDMGFAIQSVCREIEDYLTSTISASSSQEMSRNMTTSQIRFSCLRELFDRAMTGFKLREEEVALLAHLSNVHEFQAGYDRIGKCLPGTSVSVLQEISTWVSDHDGSRILWLYGLAGTGKSTIAASVAYDLEAKYQLGGTFFFSRSVTNRSKPDYIFSTIASQMASRVPKVAEGIFSAIRDDPVLGESAPIMQFPRLIVGPLISADDLLVPIVLVFDALDECTAPVDILSIIGAEAQKLPLLVKILITSRPELGIRRMMEGMGSLVRPIGLSRNNDVDRDLEVFFSESMAQVARRHNLVADWPGEAARKALVQKANGLFIWASTALKFIADEGVDDPEHQLNQVLGSFAPSQPSPWRNVDVLYLKVLTDAFTQKAAEGRLNLFRKVVGAIVTVTYPMTAPALGQLLGLGSGSENTIFQVLRKLSPVLVIDTGEPIRIIHPSFADFLTDPSRCVDVRFFVDSRFQHQYLAERCLGLMGDLLAINICKVDPSLFNSEVEDLEDRISRYIPEALQYACRFWARHLGLAGSDRGLYRIVETFFRTHLFDWLEVLSLLGALDHAFSSLDMAENWLQKFNDADAATLELASDSLRFLKRFREPISSSATHIYYSALPFTPKKSKLYQTYAGKFLNNNVEIVTGARSEWSAVLKRHSAPVTCVGFSPDGRQIVSGSRDNTVRLWDRVSSAPLGNSLEGHTDCITSLAFSPDGSRVISASNDKTLRMWDASTRAQLGEPLYGHTSDISTFKFSPDGKTIISASHDSTIRFWDGETGASVGAPLRGHTSGITAIAVSPDGQRVVSGSYDSTLRLWEVPTQKAIGEPMRGHPEHITSVAFSPDGARVISGSYDSAASWGNVLLLWDGATGEPIKALLGHTSAVTSVAFSSERAYIASGSADTTVRLWDAQTGAPVGEPLQGHSGPISAIAFSPDGTRIVSGSGDNTLRLWDVESRVCLDGPLQGHTDSITATSFSPDGRIVVSASDDHTLRIWDVPAGESIGDGEQGHKAAIVSLSFSPDGTRFVTGSWDNIIQLWDGLTGEPIGEPLRGHISAVTCLAFSADGKLLVSGSGDNMLRLWDGLTGKAIRGAMEGHTSKVTAVAFSSDGGRIVSGSWDTTLRLWDVSTGIPVGEPLRGHTAAITSVAFSSSGNIVASGAEDHRVRLWDGFGGAPSGDDLRGHTAPVMSVTFSDSGRHIISESSDLEILRWDTHSHELVPQASQKAEISLSAPTLNLNQTTGWVTGGFTGRKRLWWMPELNRGTYAYTTDGRKLVTGSKLGLVTLVDARGIGKFFLKTF